MLTRFRACVLIVLGVAVLLLYAPEAVAAPVTICDNLAGNPLDPNRITPGVAFAKIDARAAIAACQSAFKADPDNARLNYELGLALTKASDYAQAHQAYRAAADRDFAAAEDDPGGMYLTGHGVPKDASKAVAWFRRAADQGLAPARYALGLMYAEGLGVSRDQAMAMTWFKKAAAQGDPAAHVALARIQQTTYGCAGADSRS